MKCQKISKIKKWSEFSFRRAKVASAQGAGKVAGRPLGFLQNLHALAAVRGSISPKILTPSPLSSAFGYKLIFGITTDVLALKTRGLAVSCMNISCGYYNPHSAEEYTDIRELENCLRFVSSIVRNCTRVYPHHYSPPVYRYFGYANRVYGRYTEHYETEELF